MMLFICPDISNNNFDKGFSSLSSYEERYMPVKKEVELFTYWLTDGMNPESNDFANDFANEYFETQKMFDNRQNILLGFSNSIFENSRSLNKIEEEVLNVTFLKSLIKKPTLKGRR
ncbi:hypothetical protein [Flavobacterium sp. GSP14]|uniref:hypothetical protein n=1 Tax=Flavobacterium sp. GSP14 TaxID=3401734 RepID=UPI003AACAD94